MEILQIIGYGILILIILAILAIIGYTIAFWVWTLSPIIVAIGTAYLIWNYGYQNTGVICGIIMGILWCRYIYLRFLPESSDSDCSEPGRKIYDSDGKVTGYIER